ncbi:DMT family transporter [Cellulomonas hominis]|uniref:DMT family transporter n=1 Tax=Cellulomonas hominis TaxID=156981 RepID=UPI001BCF44DD|nr:DMT family transporter [Cellulomonas hominis]
MGLVWGASFLFMKVALDGTTPLQIVWTRLLLGAVALGAVVLVTRAPLPRSRALWGHFAVLGVVGCAIPFSLFAWAEQHVSSGVASIYNATTPLMTALMVTLAFRVEKLTRDRLAGVAVGLAGVVVIIAPWQLASGAGSLDEAAGQLACLGAALCYGVTFAYLRRFVTPRGVPALTTAFLQVGFGAVALLLLTPVVVGSPVDPTPQIVGSLVVLGVLGTGVAYLWNINVLLRWGPTAASTVTYITPVVGVALGVLVLDERLGWHEPAGAVLVLLGILLAQGRLRRRGRVPAAVAPVAAGPVTAEAVTQSPGTGATTGSPDLR